MSARSTLTASGSLAATSLPSSSAISALATARSSSADSTAAVPIGCVLPPITTCTLCAGLAMRAYTIVRWPVRAVGSVRG